jgi:hypothetical protein
MPPSLRTESGSFEAEHMSKLAFYLEALNRERKLSHENPSIGVHLSEHEDDEVVEYAMSRPLFLVLVARYETQMILKALLKKKLHEWILLLRGTSADAS